jgi:hypothetical protein
MAARWDGMTWFSGEEYMALRDAGRWIPVSERLPEDDQQCLTVDKDGVQRVARFDAIGDGERHSWYEEQEWKSVYPVAWMPLPEPPEVE